MKLIAIRHLVTPWNEQGLLQGRTDIELVDNDKNQALVRGLSEQLKSYQFDRVYVSPMKRAIQTAELLGYSDYIIEPLVSEISFGRFEGKPKKEMMRILGQAWISHPMDTELKEELGDLEKRIKLFIDQLSEPNNLLISHGAYIRGLSSVVATGSINNMNQMELLNGELKSFDL